MSGFDRFYGTHFHGWRGWRGRAPAPSALAARFFVIAVRVAVAISVFWIAGIGASSRAPADDAPKPLLWRIDGARPSYLFGTIHLPDDRVVDLPAAVETALRDADVIYTEVALEGAVAAELAQAMLLPGRETLQTVLPESLYARVEATLARAGLPMLVFGKLEVWAVAAQLVLLDDPSRLGKPPLDQTLVARAKQSGKETRTLETPDVQIRAMQSVGREAWIRMLGETLDQMDEARSRGTTVLDEIIDTYLAGDLEKLREAAFATTDVSRPDTRKLMKALLTDRNVGMAQTIAERIRAEGDRAHFFAVGALHYAGDAGLVSLLREKGLKIERVAR